MQLRRKSAPLVPPGMARLALVLLILTLAYHLLTQFKSLLVPIAYAGVLACLLLPVVRWLRKRRIPDALAVTAGILLAGGVCFGIFYFVGTQATDLQEDYQLLRDNYLKLLAELDVWMQAHLDWKYQNDLDTLQHKLAEAGDKLAAVAGSTLLLTTDVITVLVLIPIYAFCILIYRKRLVNAFGLMTGSSQAPVMRGVAERIRKTMGLYIVGLLVVMCVVFTLLFTGLLILDVPHALFFAMVAALANIIPYVGILVSALATSGYAMLSTGHGWMFLAVLAVFWGVHVLESNFVAPFVIGRYVRVNAFAALVGVILGGMVWGIPGMILSLPTLAALKIASTASPNLRALTVLLGDDRDED